MLLQIDEVHNEETQTEYSLYQRQYSAREIAR